MNIRKVVTVSESVPMLYGKNFEHVAAAVQLFHTVSSLEDPPAPLSVDLFRRDLINFFRNSKLTESAFADLTSVHPTTVSEWVSGASLPDAGSRASIIRFLRAGFPELAMAVGEEERTLDLSSLELARINQGNLEHLNEALAACVPAEEYRPGDNRESIPLTREQYDLLMATVASSLAFHKVETWDEKVRRVISGLRDIMKDLQGLGAEFYKFTKAWVPIDKLLRAAIAGLTAVLESISDSSSGKGKT